MPYIRQLDKPDADRFDRAWPWPVADVSPRICPTCARRVTGATWGEDVEQVVPNWEMYRIGDVLPQTSDVAHAEPCGHVLVEGVHLTLERSLAKLPGVHPMDEARREAIIVPFHEQLEYLLHALGPRMCAACLGLADTRQLGAWRTGTEVRRVEIPHRLAILYAITRAVSCLYTPVVATALIRSMNPELDDRSIMLTLADNDPAEVEAEIYLAVRAFLEK